MQDRISIVISTLRFPLAVGVVMIHSNPILPNGERLIFPMLLDIFVPLFMFISGYLYFYSNKESFGICDYKKKTISRLYSLLIPYILWNIIAIPFNTLFIGGILYRQGGISSLIADSFDKLCSPIKIFWGTYETTGIDIFGNNILSLWCMDGPLWFVRDLIFITLMSPVIYFLIRKLGIWSILILTVPVFIGLRPIATPRLSSVYWFMLGAYCCINSVKLYHSGFLLAGLSCVLPVLVNSMIDNKLIDEISSNIYVILVGAFIISGAYKYSETHNCDYIIRLGKYGFLIYAFHCLIPLSWYSKVISQLIDSQGSVIGVSFIGFIILCLIRIFICILLYLSLEWMFPKFNAFINGKGKSIIMKKSVE